MRKWLALPRSAKIKSSGYLVSTLSVILLAIVSWRSASQDVVLRTCLIGGAIASIVGMAFRLWSYEVEHGEES